MRNGKRNWSTQRKHTPVPFCTQQIPCDLMWGWSRATAMGSRRQTACAMTRP
jgi:hypothetical protein